MTVMRGVSTAAVAVAASKAAGTTTGVLVRIVYRLVRCLSIKRGMAIRSAMMLTSMGCRLVMCGSRRLVCCGDGDISVLVTIDLACKIADLVHKLAILLSCHGVDGVTLRSCRAQDRKQSQTRRVATRRRIKHADF